ncbi:hypothetical protein RFY98_17605, partial [Acinetobacter baumannii]|nr:hypothetical protein [Acinetobacter baumannii]
VLIFFSVSVMSIPFFPLTVFFIVLFPLSHPLCQASFREKMKAKQRYRRCEYPQYCGKEPQRQEGTGINHAP